MQSPLPYTIKNLKDSQPQKDSHGPSAAIKPGNLQFPFEGTFLRRAQQRGIIARTHHVWVVTGHRFVISSCYFILHRGKLPDFCLCPNCDCQTFYSIRQSVGESMSLPRIEDLKDERAGNAEVAVL